MNYDWLKDLGIEEINSGIGFGDGSWASLEGRDVIDSINPATGKKIASVTLATPEDYEKIVKESQEAFKEWRKVPAPVRGELVRQMGLKLREHKDLLGQLVTLECGKVIQEGKGEVQEMIDIADYAVGLSRNLSGPTLQSERPNHRIYEQWLPLGPIGVITSFNFPVAVWAWNAMIALVAGDTVIWKPSSTTPLTAVAVHKIMTKVLKDFGAPPVISLIIGKGSVVGDRLSTDERIPLISVTGSIPTGRRVAQKVAARFGKTILELGGNNAAIVMEDADIEIARRAVFFGAVGTAGQRCTTTRRLFLHEKIYDKFLEKLMFSYKNWVKVGDPLEEGVTGGPLIDENAVQAYLNTIEKAKEEGGKVLVGGKRIDREGYYVEPTIIEANKDMKIIKTETFAPILYVIKISSIDEALEIHNSVPQGLSSAIISNNIRYTEKFLSPEGSDCGIANVNTSTSGAEIGGAFGGEKETGGGRESGSDAWKGYMRRQTVTINYGDSLPLAQGIKFIEEEE